MKKKEGTKGGNNNTRTKEKKSDARRRRPYRTCPLMRRLGVDCQTPASSDSLSRVFIRFPLVFTEFRHDLLDFTGFR